jgi:hypothetical protein
VHDAALPEHARDLVLGGRACVPLSEIIAKLKPLWDSVHAVGAVPEDDDSDPEWTE